MAEDLIFLEVKNSKKYKNVCEDTIARICAEESLKYKASKDIIKSVKSKLHQITGAFVEDSAMKEAFEILTAWDESTTEETVLVDCEKLLKLFSSSNERIHFLKEFTSDIFSVLGQPKSILDIACGFNPFVLPFLPNYQAIEYYCSDINLKSIALIQLFFAKRNLKGEAKGADILVTIPDFYVDAVYLYKILPLLEQQKKGYSQQLINQLNCKHIVITFPTKSLSGKNVGMYDSYKSFMEKSFRELICYEKEYKNELVFILKKE